MSFHAFLTFDQCMKSTITLDVLSALLYAAQNAFYI